MTNIYIELLGYTASVIGVSMMIPQVIKMFRTKKVEDISWGTLVLYMFSGLLWVIYGYLIHSNPLAISNFIAFLIAIIQIFFKYKYTNK